MTDPIPPNDMPADTELREQAQAIISEFLVDDLAYFRFGNSFKNLTPDQKGQMLFATTDLAMKLAKRDKARDAAIRKVAGKTIEFSHTAVNGDMHLFIDDVHDPKLCPECIRPGILSTPTDQKEKK